MSSTAFIDLETAVKRSGRSAGHLSRQCRAKWAAAGQAELRKPAGGGKAAWHVREDADPAFARVKSADQVGTDLRPFTEDQRNGAIRRRRILAEWDAFCVHAAAMKFDRDRATNTFVERKLIDDDERVSRTQLYEWAEKYRTGGLAALVDGRGGGRAAAAADPFLDEVRRLYLSPRRPKLTLCHELAVHKAREQGWTVRSYKTCQRAVARVESAVVFKMRGGEEAYVNRAEPYLERDYTTLASNEVWCSDHHQFDVVVRDGDRHVRPWLTAFQDVRSRKIVARDVYAHDPNSDAIFSVFRRAVLAHGVPAGLLIDNGKDYDCAALNGRTKKDRWARRKVRVDIDPDRAAGLFGELGVAVQHAQPYHGQSKPIERWFGTVETKTVVWPTYCGNAPTAKPEDLQLQIERGNAPTLADFAAWFDAWVVEFNAGHAHQGQGMDGRTPDQVYAANLQTVRTAPAGLLDLLCLKRVDGVKVQQNGVTVDGLRYGQFEPALQRLLGQQVNLRVDERDVSRVQVYDAAGRFVCLAPSNVAVPFNASRQDLRQAMGDKRRSRQLLKEYQQRRPRMADDLPETLLRRAAERSAAARAADGPPPPGPNIRPVRHALESQLDAVQRASEAAAGRQAVGAESVPLPGRFLYGQTGQGGAADAGPAPAGPSFRSLMGGQGEDAHE